MKKQIEVVIDKEGNVQIEAIGYTDGSCRSATEAIEKALGGVKARELKRGGACNEREKETQ